MKKEKQFLLKGIPLLCFVLFISLFHTQPLKAAGTITDGGSTFVWNSVGAISNGASANWIWEPAGPDHAFAYWFWYRINAETQEIRLPVPDVESYVGNTATLTWNNVSGKNFAVVVTLVLTDGAGPASTFNTSIKVTNNTGAPLNIEIFNYIDLDKQPTTSNDVASLICQALIEVTDGPNPATACQFGGIGSNAWQVTAFQVLLLALNDAGITNLNNTGLPFGPADWTGAFQWSLTIPIGGMETVMAGAGAPTFSGACSPPPAPVPTLSQWGIFLFALSLLGLGLVVAYNVQAQRQLALTTSANTTIGGGFNIGSFSLPFERKGYSAMLLLSLALAGVGFVAIYFIWGEITKDDLIGMAVAMPLMAYVLYLMKKK